MTPEMLELARNNAVKADLARNIEFREGVIENLPVVNDSADVVISNCVINLSPDKPKVFKEVHRILKLGGRMIVSDIALSKALPEMVLNSDSAYCACISGAAVIEDLVAHVEQASLTNIHVDKRSIASTLDLYQSDPLIAAAMKSFGRDAVEEIAKTIWSVTISAEKACPPSPRS
jgi:arsenite methyltransferase